MNHQQTMLQTATDSDFIDLMGTSSAGSPERRLLAAILERAVLDYVGNNATDITEAEQWIFEEPYEAATSSEYSFSWVCRELDLEPSEISSKISAMPKRGKNRIAPWYFMKHEQKKRV